MVQIQEAHLEAYEISEKIRTFIMEMVGELICSPVWLPKMLTIRLTRGRLMIWNGTSRQMCESVTIATR